MKSYENLVSENRIDELMNYSYDFHPSRYISEGFDIFKKDLGNFIGYEMLTIIIGIIASIIPGAGVIISMPIQAGYYIAAHKNDRNEAVKFNDFFGGFNHFGELLVVYILILLMMLAICVPIGIAAAITLMTESPVLLILAIIITIIGAFYLVISYSFAPMLVLFGGKKGWEAMEISRKIVANNFADVFVFTLLQFLVNLAGLLCLGIGVLFTYPATLAAQYAAFADLFELDDMGHDHDEILDHLI